MLSHWLGTAGPFLQNAPRPNQNLSINGEGQVGYVRLLETLDQPAAPARAGWIG